jgi:L,D-transpeptidase-like protein
MRYLSFTLIVLCFIGLGFLFLSNNTPVIKTTTTPVSVSWLDKTTHSILAHVDNIDPTVLKTSLIAYQKARQEGLDDKEVLTIIDYSKPSTMRRLWVIDLKTDQLLFNTWVAHGRNSGEKNSTSFSNSPQSLKSSIGVYLTDEIYMGHNGYSLRIQGLEPGFNDNALKRDIVFHGAAYVGGDVVKNRGMLGRSWGCMAVALNTIKPLVNAIKDQTLVVAYYPDKKWLTHSLFLS